MKLVRRAMNQARSTTVEGPNTVTTDDASAWLRGEGDLFMAAMGRTVPVPVQLGVFAHGSLERLTTLGRFCRRGSVRNTWGSEMASLAGDIARFAGTPGKLAALQSTMLVPLELEVLGGRRVFADRGAAAAHIRSVISLEVESGSVASAAGI